jgi:hypothetical protein
MTRRTFARLPANLITACNVKETAMTKFQKQVRELATQVGDPTGFSEETIDYIACELQVSYDDVEQVFDQLVDLVN